MMILGFKLEVLCFMDCQIAQAKAAGVCKAGKVMHFLSLQSIWKISDILSSGSSNSKLAILSYSHSPTSLSLLVGGVILLSMHAQYLNDSVAFDISAQGVNTYNLLPTALQAVVNLSFHSVLKALQGYRYAQCIDTLTHI